VAEAGGCRGEALAVEALAPVSDGRVLPELLWDEGQGRFQKDQLHVHV